MHARTVLSVWFRMKARLGCNRPVIPNSLPRGSLACAKVTILRALTASAIVTAEMRGFGVSSSSNLRLTGNDNYDIAEIISTPRHKITWRALPKVDVIFHTWCKRSSTSVCLMWITSTQRKRKSRFGRSWLSTLWQLLGLGEEIPMWPTETGRQGPSVIVLSALDVGQQFVLGAVSVTVDFEFKMNRLTFGELGL